MKNPVFKGMMNSGNCKQKIVPNKKKEVEKYYFEEDDYINSSPLTPEQKKYLSESYVGEAKVDVDSFLGQILKGDKDV